MKTLRTVRAGCKVLGYEGTVFKAEDEFDYDECNFMVLDLQIKEIGWAEPIVGRCLTDVLGCLLFGLCAEPYLKIRVFYGAHGSGAEMLMHEKTYPSLSFDRRCGCGANRGICDFHAIYLRGHFCGCASDVECKIHNERGAGDIDAGEYDGPHGRRGAIAHGHSIFSFTQPDHDGDDDFGVGDPEGHCEQWNLRGWACSEHFGYVGKQSERGHLSAQF